MDRTYHLTLAGKEYPLNFSVAAAEAVTERYGDLASVADRLGGGTVAEKLAETIWLLALLLKQGADYQRLVEGTEVRVWSEDELRIIISIGDLPRLQGELMAAMTAGMAQTVEVEGDPKNAEATRDN